MNWNAIQTKKKKNVSSYKSHFQKSKILVAIPHYSFWDSYMKMEMVNRKCAWGKKLKQTKFMLENICYVRFSSHLCSIFVYILIIIVIVIILNLQLLVLLNLQSIPCLKKVLAKFERDHFLSLKNFCSLPICASSMIYL